MTRSHLTMTWAALASGLAFLIPALGQESPPPKDEPFAPIQYADASVSLNDRCPVRLARLNPRMDPVYVNGKPIGFC